MSRRGASQRQQLNRALRQSRSTAVVEAERSASHPTLTGLIQEDVDTLTEEFRQWI
jgi:hypothetical protein